MKVFATVGIDKGGKWTVISGPNSDYAGQSADFKALKQLGSSEFDAVRMVDLSSGTIKRAKLADAEPAKKKTSKKAE